MNIRTGILAVVAFAVVATSTLPAALAQSSNGVAASAPSKAVAKAQRKADRKLSRSKNKVELNELEKNGYHPGGDQTDYPQNLQSAEKKSAAAKGASSQ